MTGFLPITPAGRGTTPQQVPVAGLIVALVLTVPALVGVSLMIGTYPLGAADVIRTLGGTPPSDTAATVVWLFRFPRALSALLVGALLALSGAALQIVTRNPLADPSLVGVSQGAALAVVAATVLAPGFATGLRPVLAFGGALGVAAVILGLSSGRHGGQTARFILIGIGVAAFVSAVTATLLTYGDLDQALSALGWLAGSVHAAGWAEVRMLALAAAVTVPPLLAGARALSVLRFGDEVAIALGLRVQLARTVLVVLSVALAAFAVAAVGPLGFVGLVAPHLARRLARTGIALHLILSALTGALLVCAADLLGRAAFAPLQVPAGLVTAIIGVPVFVWLILHGQSRGQL